MRKTASVGSPLYYSPEIVMGVEYDEKIDIWDIGMMTYECLLGKIPFRIYSELDLNRIVPFLIILGVRWNQVPWVHRNNRWGKRFYFENNEEKTRRTNVNQRNAPSPVHNKISRTKTTNLNHERFQRSFVMNIYTYLLYK